MKVTVRVSQSFMSAAKPLLKKYPSLSKDLLKLENNLQKNPSMGTSLGNNCYKIRLKISSKGKGKSAGARVISFVETLLITESKIMNEEVTVKLVTIYDKSTTANITDKELKYLIKRLTEPY